ncbi:transcriptional regulator, TetR family [Pseudarthrobacter chlorophenolicus A6]|uniref:Transcriptional regulator, TetR family n=1 Tax=Pseudarthrobacter chlorophenolicus (strain ATCC 700700 / DSM 12829 / CIP 107037 / JCM 12360 / KCTC 9906 / NCIMB 13794 / A6) TaxID=452863 RepID=B8HAL2_PSECP|nr:TetR/AcrR family transcriptional regulator [Pseudarthrobacter chlorophenolicus]ACL38473.1 transcriptional regulator, TetR family [Pseudarthrobacter chlorophenolicus A6]SDQ47993.1 DNA-binding transcriptional regulator, AcrR family [Pseudarthrobacter chlorophenolicus]
MPADVSAQPDAPALSVAASAPSTAASASEASAATPSARPPARQLLLEAAARLFYAQGVGATGIDTITAAAGVAKKSLYNNFASKADLVAAYLEARHEEWLDLYRARVAIAATPSEQVLAVFDAYLDHANFAYEHGFRGCGLLNAAAELPVGHPGRLAVRQHKEEVEHLLATHVAAYQADRPAPAASPDASERTAGLARHLSFLLEGAMARAGLEGDDSQLRDAKRIAQQMLAGL